MGLSCPSCGNEQHFQVKTLQVHVVQVDGEHVGISHEDRPAVLEVLCDECEEELDLQPDGASRLGAIPANQALPSEPVNRSPWRARHHVDHRRPSRSTRLQNAPAIGAGPDRLCRGTGRFRAHAFSHWM